MLMTENQISREIIGSAITIHKSLGPGLLESAYRECLKHELVTKGFHVEKEKPVPIQYKSIYLKQAYRIDLLVNDLVVVELKAVDALTDVHLAQVLTYLRFGGFHLGLLLNFNVHVMKSGIRRIIH